MKSIKLLNLKLVNFKGIKEFELDASGNDIKVFGDNATGKTTIFDAFVWLLFNKDSQNKADFEIKTLVDGKPIHKLNHEVEAVLLIDNKQLTLRKVYSEKWTKKRGSITDRFSGHTTDYYINDVPAKKKEFDEKIKEILDEDVFRLLTNPNQFNEQLHWKDRRDLLLEIAGDITDDDVIASDKSLAKLLDVLNGKSIDDHKKIIASKRREINKEIEKIPVRIDEINRNLPDLTGLDEAKLKTDIDKLSFEIEAKNDEINSIKNGSEANELKKKISDIELQISNVRNEHTQNEQQEVYKLEAKLQEEESNYNILKNDMRDKMTEKKRAESWLEQLHTDLEDIKAKGQALSKEEFDGEHTCPTCTQALPADQIEQATANFNKNKSERLEKLRAGGNKTIAEIEEQKVLIEKIEKDIEKITANGQEKAKQVEKVKGQLEKAKSTVKPIEENEQYIKLNDEKQALEQQVKLLEQSVSDSINKVRAEINDLKFNQQGQLQKQLSQFGIVKASKERILQLEEQEKSLAAEYEELEHQLHLAEEFTRTKVNMLTESINSKFKYARFNLFKENINGGLEEICETTFDGVPYSSGLNNAARINVGLDIINTLSEHYGVQAPIFVDNAESVTQLIEIESQVISLVVSEKDKELRVESKSDQESEVA